MMKGEKAVKSKKIKIFFILVILVMLFSNSLNAEEKIDFEKCYLCNQKIEELYQNDEIEIADYLKYRFYISNFPFQLPQEARCEIHKYLIKSIKHLLSNKDDYLDNKVTLEVTFEGWGGPIVSRSDWLIKDSSGEIVVNGSFPAGLNPAEKGDKGKDIMVTGYLRKIKIDGEDNYYLEKVDSKAEQGEEFNTE